MSDPSLEKMRAIAAHWMEARRWDKAEPILRSILAANAADLDAYDMLSTLMFERGDCQAARTIVGHWLKAGPPGERVMALLALCEIELGNQAVALQAAEMAVKSAPQGSFARGVLAHVQLQSGDPAKAMNTALEALQLFPGEFNALRTLAWASLQNGRPDLTERAARQLLMLAPDESFTLSAAGRLLRALGFRAEGMRLLRDMLVRDPANPRCHLALGHAYWDRGDVPTARRYFREALRLNPKLEEVRKLLRIGRRSTENELPKGIRHYTTITTFDQNGHKIVQKFPDSR